MTRSIEQLARDIKALGISRAYWPETSESGLLVNETVVVREPMPRVRIVGNGVDLGEIPVSVVMGRQTQAYLAEALALLPEERTLFQVDPDTVEEQVRQAASVFLTWTVQAATPHRIILPRKKGRR